MHRSTNSDRQGRSFDGATVSKVWLKGRIIPGYDPATYRADACGARIYRWAHGELTPFGWEVDHDKPVAAGGGDELSNLQPLQWQNNRGKGDSHPTWYCTVRAA